MNSMTTITHAHEHHHPIATQSQGFDIFSPLRRWLDAVEVKNARFAHLICQVIPCCCPFERDITLFGRTLFRIPALCKLNPLYNEFVSLRFRALSYLADECNQDITAYIC